ncbi:MAG: alpha/beta fold hydrolase [Baekduiaceae bacterium]
MAPETRYVRSGDVHIAYQTVGDGPLDLVFVPSWLSHIELLWEEPHIVRMLERLAGFSRLILFDRRGSGLSDGWGGASSIDEQVEDVHAVLDAVGAEQPALFAMTEGAAMAAMFAATHPAMVRALALYAPMVCAVRSDDGYEWQDTPAVRDARTQEMLAQWGSGALADRFAPSRADDPELRRWFGRLERFSAAPSSAARHIDLVGKIDVRGVLPSIQCPTLVLHRTEDDLFDVRNARYVAEHVPNAQFRELPGRDNLLAIGDAETALAEIEQFLTGTRRPVVSDRVLAPVLFTDIVDSTGHAARLGDRSWRELLERHDGLMRAEVERHRGRMVKTLGDGALAVFDAPSRAIGTAVTVRARVHELGLQVRAGLHTGECELVGDDVGGLAVHISARVTGEAGPDEVLVSSTVRDLLVGSGIGLQERGERELRGVPGAWRIYAVDV